MFSWICLFPPILAHRYRNQSIYIWYIIAASSLIFIKGHFFNGIIRCRFESIITGQYTMLFLLYLLTIPLTLFWSLENVHFFVCSKVRSKDWWNRVQTELPFAFHLALKSQICGREVEGARGKVKIIARKETFQHNWTGKLPSRKHNSGTLEPLMSATSRTRRRPHRSAESRLPIKDLGLLGIDRSALIIAGTIYRHEVN